jgi:NADH-quinone oxidoreductase subunit N
MLSILDIPLLLAQSPLSASRQSPLPDIDAGGLILDSLRFAPELIVCAALVLLLVFRLFPAFDKVHLGAISLMFALVALGLSICQWWGQYGMEPPVPNASKPVFGGLLLYDPFTVYLRCFLYLFAALLIVLSLATRIPDADDSADFYVLLLGATLGMVLMAMSNHLLMVFIAVEMASLPSYALAGFLKGKRQSSEAALKYVVYGGGAAGIMLYGISLLAGKFGTGYLPDLALAYVLAVAPPGQGIVLDPVVLLGTLFLLIGVAFKLSAVPFHFWCPDVFEGASAEVAGFLSVASKGAALALLVRIVYLLGGLDTLVTTGQSPTITASWMALTRYLIGALAFIAALTATFGNLAAYFQNNLKRLLAYSTIAQAGYMLMAVAVLGRIGVEALLFYLAAYLFMNLGAFAVVAFLRNETGSEELSDFRGLIRRSPFMVIVLSFFLLSLLGLPPLVGFTAKFQVFNVLYMQGQTYSSQGEPGLGVLMYGLLVIGGLNTVLSAFYYLRVLRVMILDRLAEDLEGTEPAPLRESVAGRVFTGLLALAVFLLGILWGPLDALSRAGATQFSTKPGTGAGVVVSSPGRGMPGGGPARGPGRGPRGPKQ